MTKDETRAVSVRIPEAVYRKARVLAAAKDTTFNGLVVDLLEQAVENLEAVQEAIDDLYRVREQGE